MGTFCHSSCKGMVSLHLECGHQQCGWSSCPLRYTPFHRGCKGKVWCWTQGHLADGPVQDHKKQKKIFKTDFFICLKPTKYLNTIYLYLFTTGIEITSTIALISACFSISSSS